MLCRWVALLFVADGQHGFDGAYVQVALREGYLNVVGIECVVDGLFYAPCHDKFLFDEHPVGYEQVDTVVAKLVKHHADGLLGADDVAAVGLLALQLFYCVNEQ